MWYNCQFNIFFRICHIICTLLENLANILPKTTCKNISFLIIIFKIFLNTIFFFPLFSSTQRPVISQIKEKKIEKVYEIEFCFEKVNVILVHLILNTIINKSGRCTLIISIWIHIYCSVCVCVLDPQILKL